MNYTIISRRNGASRQWSEPGSSHVTTHCTAWDSRRDVIISQPPATS